MSVLAMSADVQDRELTGRKRSHGDFLDQESCGALAFKDSEHINVDLSLSDKENDVPFLGATASPSTKSSSGLSEPACSPLEGNPPSLNLTPAALSTSKHPSVVEASTTKAAGEPPKKKRSSAEDKAASVAALEAEKRKRLEEREQKKREKEEAEKLKAEQRAARAADKAEKEQGKRQRAEEREKRKREKEEEEAKKARSQMKLTNMFNRAPAAAKEPATTKPQEANSAGATASGEAKGPSLYEQMFRPFFVKEHVHLASNRCQLDEETREAKTRILDEHLSGKRGAPLPVFDPLEALQIPCGVRRGRVYPSVRKIMEEFDGLSFVDPNGVTTESQSAQIRHTLEALKSVPVKLIKFREDVRPPYIGTISGLPPGGKSLLKLARNPVSRNILELNYDYDSEAEWQEEEGEDVDDLDDDEEDGDVDEDMADFLDDSEDVGPSRMGFTSSLEPESTGPCWEDRTRRTAELRLYKYRLEYVLEPLEHHHSIDPFSSAYWEAPKSKASAGNDTSTASASTFAPVTSASRPTASNHGPQANPMAPPPAPSDAFRALNSAATATAAGGATTTKKLQQPLPAEMQEKLKDLVRSMPTLSKIGVIELFAANNPGCPRAQIKTSFDALFEKAGKVFKVRGE